MPLNTEEVNLIFGTLHMTKSHKAASSTAATKTKSDRPSGKQSGMVQSKRMQKHRQSSKAPLRAPVKILIIATVAIVVLLLLDAVLSSIMRPIAIERADNTRKAGIVNTVTELMDGFLKKIMVNSRKVAQMEHIHVRILLTQMARSIEWS